MKTGKLPENVLRRAVLRQIETEGGAVLSGAGIGKDCAILAFLGEGDMAVRMQEGMLGPAAGSDAVTMETLIQKCANNLAAAGSIPFAAMVTLLLPEETEEAYIRILMAEAQKKCRELGMEIAGGQTRVLSELRTAVGVITGMGRVWAGGDCEGRDGQDGECASGKHGQGKAWTERRPRPGQDVVLSKWIGLEGTALLAAMNRERLLERYPRWLVEEAAGFGRYLSVLPEAEVGMRFGPCAMHDASEGGIFGALWELAEGAGAGLEIDMRKLPVRQETVEICECCGVNPYELLSGGCLVMAAEDGAGLAAELKKEGIPAAVVGKITAGNDRLLVNGDEVRYMDRPQRDGIYHFAP